jgi:RNA polymerase-associated protein
MTLHRIQRDWDSLVGKFLKGRDKEKLAKELCDSLTVIAPIFEQKPYFMSDELSLLDCAIAPILWRLPSYGVKLPNSAKLVEAYADRLFALDSFQTSLTEKEREIRE